MSKLVEESQEKPEIIEKTSEEELEELKNNEIWLKDQINQPDSVLRNIYNTDSPKKDVIVSWAMNLERQHELEIKLDLQLTVETVGGISTYIKDELRKLNVHPSTLHYVHEVLGVKYKYEKKNRYNRVSEEDDLSGSSPQDSSKTIADYKLENQSILEMISQQKQLLTNFETKAKSSPILSTLSADERLRYEENNLRIQATQLLADQIIDDRQSVPIYAQLKLVMAIVSTTNNFAAGMYVSQIKKFGASKMQDSEEFYKSISNSVMAALLRTDRVLYKTTLRNIKQLRTKIMKIEQKLAKKRKSKKESRKPKSDFMTSKQAMKTLFGMVKKVLSVFDPMTRDDAILDGCYGITCPECGSLRVREREHPDSHEWLCFCYDCEWWMEAKTVIKCGRCHIPFFEDILDIILKNAIPITNKKGEPIGAMEATCPRCENDLILPAKMFQVPKLRGK